MVDREDHFEGCGKEGPLRAIFFAEFHLIQGPIMRCQVPVGSPEVVTKDIFDAVSVYIIPKLQLARRTVTVNTLGFKIVGYPIILEDNKYKRNQFMFNVCFVCHSWSRTVQYEAALKKLSEYLVSLEMENKFLSNEENAEKLRSLLDTIHHDLNAEGLATITVSDKMLQLKVIPSKAEAENIQDHHVPVLLMDSPFEGEWDLTTQQILPFINGINFVSKIALLSSVDTNLARACVQNLCFQGLATVIPIFAYSNSYCVTPQLQTLREDRALRDEFLSEIRISADAPTPAFREIYKFVCAFSHGSTLRDVCARFQVREALNVNEVALVQFLVLRGILRRIQKYPYCLTEATSTTDVQNLFTGNRSYDEISFKTGMTYAQLDEIVESDPNVVLIRK